MQKKQGISLIVLVITIIVMIILAATVVISLNSNSVIDRANQAVVLTNDQQVQNIASIVWSESIIDKLKDEALRSKVLEELSKQGITEDKWNIEVSNNGIVVTNKDKAYDKWDGTTDTTWYSEEKKDLVIETAEQLVGLMQLAGEGNKFAGQKITIESNIDLAGAQWTTITDFRGELNGNNHVISNLSIDATSGNAGLFNSLNSADGVTPATIKDLTISNVTATVGSYRFAVLARSINKTNLTNITIKNVNVTTTSASSFVAGLFCQATINSEVSVSNCTVENFTVNAEKGATLIAGISAFAQRNGTEADGTNTIENLHVKNFKVNVNDTDGTCIVGGLFGQTQSVWQNPKFINCSVSGLDVTATGKVDVGGFICYPGSVTFAENCTTEGKIDVTGVTAETNFAGGFFANFGWGDNVGKGDHKVTNCTADVDITTSVAKAGGFIGSGTNSEGKNKTITLTNCVAKGAINCIADGNASVGGFVGECDRGNYVNCLAMGEVNGQTYAGGFIGRVIVKTADMETNLTNCSGSSVVTGETGKIGGIIGFIDNGTKVTLTGNTNNTNLVDSNN